jgi:hypothetical protein
MPEIFLGIVFMQHIQQLLLKQRYECSQMNQSHKISHMLKDKFSSNSIYTNIIFLDIIHRPVLSKTLSSIYLKTQCFEDWFLSPS